MFECESVTGCVFTTRAIYLTCSRLRARLQEGNYSSEAKVLHAADASSGTSRRMSGMRACPHNSCSVVGGDRRRRCVTPRSNEDIIQEHLNVSGEPVRLLKH